MDTAIEIIGKLIVDNDRMRAALRHLLFLNKGIKAGRGNYHEDDHIGIISHALGDEQSEKSK